MKISLGDVVYLVQQDRSVNGPVVGDEGVVIEAREKTLNVAWSIGKDIWVHRSACALKPPTRRADVKVGDLVSLKTDTYTIDRRKLSRRDHSLPPRGTSGTIKMVDSTRAQVAWNGHRTRWVDLNCLTVGPTPRELEEVYKSFGIPRSSGD